MSGWVSRVCSVVTHRHPHFLQQGQEMASGRSAIDAELMLEAKDIRVTEIQEIGGPPVRIQFFFLEFEAHPVRVFIAIGTIIDGTRKTIRFRQVVGDRLAKVGGERSYPAQAGKVVSQEGYPLQ
jgi:hypothetical protein